MAPTITHDELAAQVSSLSKQGEKSNVPMGVLIAAEVLAFIFGVLILALIAWFIRYVRVSVRVCYAVFEKSFGKSLGCVLCRDRDADSLRIVKNYNNNDRAIHNGR